MALERGTVIDGKYEILKEIGRGGMSVVYLAMDNRLNKQWAVKVLQRQGIGKNNEIIINKVPDDTELMKRLDHPAIPRIVDIIDRPDDPQIYIVMDYVEGESLDKILEEFGAQPQELVIDWAKQICDTLGYLHSQKPPIIYRDMKPANIMLKPEGNVKLIDFGIAREFKEQNLADTTALGTRGYASPEHFGGRTDARSDIYTLGMTMHHLLTGADPRPKSYEYIPIREYNPELSSGLEHIIDKCTAWDPDDRYQNCNELMYDLEHYTEIDDDFRKKQRNKMIVFFVSIAMVIVFTIVGGTFIYLSNNRYDALVADANTSMSDAQTAIDIDASRKEAYLHYLDLIEATDEEKLIEQEAESDTGNGKNTNDPFVNFKTAFDKTTMNKHGADYQEVAFEYIKALMVYSTKAFSERITAAGRILPGIVEEKNDAFREAFPDSYKRAELYYNLYKIYQIDISKNDEEEEEASGSVNKDNINEFTESLQQYVADVGSDDKNSYSKMQSCKFVNGQFLIPHISDFHDYGISQDEVQKVLDDMIGILQNTKSKNQTTNEKIKTVIDECENTKSVIDTEYSTVVEGSNQ